MDALVTVCSRNTHVMWSGHGCTGNRMLSKQEGYHGLDMDALVTVCSGNTQTLLWFWAWMCWLLCMDAQVEEWSPSSAERRKNHAKASKITEKSFKSPGDLHARHQLYSIRVLGVSSLMGIITIHPHGRLSFVLDILGGPCAGPKAKVLPRNHHDPGPPKVCRIMAFWAIFRGFRPLFYLLMTGYLEHTLPAWG